MLAEQRDGERMPLPSYTANGILPPIAGVDPTNLDRSPYIVTMTEMVTAFGTTPHRRQLLRNLISYRQLITVRGYTLGLQFLDGSFVENIEAHSGREPGDIDVFSLLHVPQQYLQDPAAWHASEFQYWATEIQNLPLNKARFKLEPMRP